MLPHWKIEQLCKLWGCRPEKSLKMYKAAAVRVQTREVFAGVTQYFWHDENIENIFQPNVFAYFWPPRFHLFNQWQECTVIMMGLILLLIVATAVMPSQFQLERRQSATYSPPPPRLPLRSPVARRLAPSPVWGLASSASEWGLMLWGL